MKLSSSTIYFTLPILLSIIFSCASAPSSKGVRVDNVPMYGTETTPRSPEQQKADEELIKKAEAAFGSRYEASKAWWWKGEEYRRKGNLDFAMRRYNQSWLLDPGNYQPYWGFGLVMSHQGRIDEAIKYLERAEELVNDDYQKAALLSDLGNAYTNKALDDQSYFRLSDQKLKESTELDPTYANSWGNWAYSLYHQGKYKEAWEKVHKVRDLNGPPFSTQFISELNEQMPEPK